MERRLPINPLPPSLLLLKLHNQRQVVLNANRGVLTCHGFWSRAGAEMKGLDSGPQPDRSADSRASRTTAGGPAAHSPPFIPAPPALSPPNSYHGAADTNFSLCSAHFPTNKFACVAVSLPASEMSSVKCQTCAYSKLITAAAVTLEKEMY